MVTLPAALPPVLVTLRPLISLQLAGIVLWTGEESNSPLPLGACEREAMLRQLFCELMS